MSINMLPPTLRENYRYVVFEVISKKDIAFSEIVENVWRASLALFGDSGTSEMSLWVPGNLYDSSKKKGIIRTNHLGVEKLRAAIASIREMNGEPVVFVILGVTGTIRSAKNKFLGIKDLKDFSGRL